MVSPAKILLTTSRNPTPKTRTFCNDLARVIPSIVRVNRGKMSADEVGEKALEFGADRVVIVDRWQRGTGSIRFFRLDESGLVSTPPIIHVVGIRLRREFSVVSKVKPALSLMAELSGRVLRVSKAVSKFFGIPIQPMDETTKSDSALMRIMLDEHNRIVITFVVEPNHIEVGPRIIVSGVEW